MFEKHACDFNFMVVFTTHAHVQGFIGVHAGCRKRAGCRKQPLGCRKLRRCKAKLHNANQLNNFSKA